MGLTALLAACRDSDDEAPDLCATMMVAGRTLIEHQAHVARTAGADTIVVYADRATPAIRHALERLSQQGLRIKHARNAAELVDFVHPTDRVLLIADGIVVSGDIAARLIAYPGEAIATIADIPVHAAFERLDGRARWAGVAVLNGSEIAALRTIPDDWDVQSTLLRTLMQQAVHQQPIDDMLAPAGDAVLTLADSEGALDGIEQLLVRVPTDAPVQESWFADRLYGGMARAFGPSLLRYGVHGAWLVLVALAAQLLAIGLFAIDRPASGALATLIATPIHVFARMIGTVRCERDALFTLAGPARRWLDAGAVVAIGVGLCQAHQHWGYLVLVGGVLLHCWYLRQLPAERAEKVTQALRAPDMSLAAPLLLVLAIAGLWAFAPLAMLAWAIGAFVARWRAPMAV